MTGDPRNLQSDTRRLVDPEFIRTVMLVTVRGRPHSPAVGAFARQARAFHWPKSEFEPMPSVDPREFEPGEVVEVRGKVARTGRLSLSEPPRRDRRSGWSRRASQA